MPHRMATLPSLYQTVLEQGHRQSQTIPCSTLEKRKHPTLAIKREQIRGTWGASSHHGSHCSFGTLSSSHALEGCVPSQALMTDPNARELLQHARAMLAKVCKSS
jgi:hypothetical protein